MAARAPQDRRARSVDQRTRAARSTRSGPSSTSWTSRGRPRKRTCRISPIPARTRSTPASTRSSSRSRSSNATATRVPDARRRLRRRARRRDRVVDGQQSSVVSPERRRRRLATRPVLGSSAKRTVSAEEAIAALRAKIERLGPVNMMAIEQFDELEARHTFLTTAAQGPGRFDRPDERSDQAHRRDDHAALRRGVRRDQPQLPADASARCSAAAAPA